MIAFLFGTAIVVWLVHSIHYANSNHWRYLAARYGRPWAPADTSFLGHLILYGKHPLAKDYNGITRFSVHRDGIAIKVVMPPDSLYCDPLFIPYGDIRGWKQFWFINAKSVELELRRAPEVKLVMPKGQVEKIQAASGTRLAVTQEMSPNRDKPVLWHALMLAIPVVMISQLGIVLAVKWLNG